MVLERILAAKRQEVARRKQLRPLATLGPVEPTTRSLRQALTHRTPAFILECKRASPSAGVLRPDYDPAALARQYEGVAAAISVLTDEPFFGGRPEDLQCVRAVTTLPLLCKDFIVDPYQVFEARAHGADAVLLMLAVLDAETLGHCQNVSQSLGMDALVEVHDEAELQQALALQCPLIGINNRNLKTLHVDLAVTERLAPLVPPQTVVVCESGMASHQDVLRLRGLVDAFLIGSSLMKHPDVGRVARQLVYGRVKVCGLTRPVDAVAAHQQGATWGGLIFVPASPRCVTVGQAVAVRAAAPLKWAGVFATADPRPVAECAHALHLAAVQLHGPVCPDPAALRVQLPAGCEIWRALPVADTLPSPSAWQGADRLLLDAQWAGQSGGTGHCFDWRLLIAESRRSDWIVAGGLNAANAAAADRLAVWALDVNSGVEQAPGCKDLEKLAAFFAALRGKGKGWP